MILPGRQNRKGLLFILTAVLCGLVAAALVFFAGLKMAPTIPVLVAVQDISPGDPLSSNMFQESKMPQAGLPEGVISPTADISNYLAKNGMSPGDILKISSVIELDEKNPSLLSARLKALNDDSLVAMEVPAEAAAGLLNGMKTGDRVNIIFVEQTGVNQAQPVFQSSTIIKSVKVIGVKPQDDTAGVLIVALTEEQAEILAAAREKGKIFAALRPFGAAVTADEPQQPVEEQVEQNTGGQ